MRSACQCERDEGRTERVVGLRGVLAVSIAELIEDVVVSVCVWSHCSCPLCRATQRDELMERMKRQKSERLNLSSC